MNNDKLRAIIAELLPLTEMAFLREQMRVAAGETDRCPVRQIRKRAQAALADNVPVDQDEVERMHDWLRDEAAIQCVGPDNDLHIDGDTWEHVFAPALRTRSNEDIFERNAEKLSNITDQPATDGAEDVVERMFEIARPCFHYAAKGTPDGAMFERSETGRLLRNALRKIAALTSTAVVPGMVMISRGDIQNALYGLEYLNRELNFGSATSVEQAKSRIAMEHGRLTRALSAVPTPEGEDAQA